MSNFSNNSDEQFNDLSSFSSSSIDKISYYYGEKYLQEREDFLQQILPNDQRLRMMIMNQLKTIENELEFRQKSLAIARQAQIQVIQEVANNYQKQGKLSSQGQTGEFIQEIVVHYQSKITSLFNQIETCVNESYTKIEQIKHPSPTYKKRMEDQLDKEINQLFDMRNKLFNDFMNSINSINY